MTWTEVCRDIHNRPKGARRAGWPDGMLVRSPRWDSRNTDRKSPYYGMWTFTTSIDFYAPLEVFEEGQAMGYDNSIIQSLHCQYSTSDDWEWIV